MEFGHPLLRGGWLRAAVNELSFSGDIFRTTKSLLTKIVAGTNALGDGFIKSEVTERFTTQEELLDLHHRRHVRAARGHRFLLQNAFAIRIGKGLLPAEHDLVRGDEQIPR